jgi:hypothetical protein
MVILHPLITGKLPRLHITDATVFIVVNDGNHLQAL